MYYQLDFLKIDEPLFIIINELIYFTAFEILSK